MTHVRKALYHRRFDGETYTLGGWSESQKKAARIKALIAMAGRKSRTHKVGRTIFVYEKEK